MARGATTTRDKIIAQAITLLNDKGLSNVSLRDVSNALGISIGNLTYYFPRWDNLIDEIFGNLEAEFAVLFTYFPKDLNEVPAYTSRIYDLQIRYAFMFANFYQFFEKYPRFNEKKMLFFEERMTEMHSALNRLIAKELLYPESDAHDYNLLVKETWIIFSGWYSFSLLFKGSSYAMSKNDFFLFLWNLYALHLTPRGKSVVYHAYKALNIK